MTGGANRVSERSMVARVGTCSRSAKNRPVNQSQHVSSCFQRSQVEEHERVLFCETTLSKEALLNRIDSSQLWFWLRGTQQVCETPLSESIFDLYT